MLTHEQRAELDEVMRKCDAVDFSMLATTADSKIRYILEQRECGWCIIDTQEINPDEPPLAILQWRCAAELCVTALNSDLAKQSPEHTKARWT